MTRRREHIQHEIQQSISRKRTQGSQSSELDEKGWLILDDEGEPRVFLYRGRVRIELSPRGQALLEQEHAL